MRKYLIYVILLSIVEIGLALYITFWRELFWNYIEAKNFSGFSLQISIFTVVALAYCFVSAYSGYFTTLCVIKWREILNVKACAIKSTAENLNQRIQEDCTSYPDLFFNLVVGLGKAFIYVIVFSISMCLNFSYIYLIIILVYAILATGIAQRIAAPLVGLNYSTQMAEATYRNNITSINFKNCIAIMTTLALKTKNLSYFQTFYGQIAVILPVCIIAPSYFWSALTLGGLMQATGTMSTIIDNMSFGITSFNIINKFRSCRKRLHEIGMFNRG